MVVTTRTMKTRSNTSATKNPRTLSLVALSIKSPNKSPNKRGPKKSIKRGSLKKAPAVDTEAGQKERRGARAAGQQSARKERLTKSRAKVDASLTSLAVPAQPSYRKEATGMAKKLLAIITRVAEITPSPINRGMFEFFDYLPTTTKCFEGILARRQDNPKIKTWIFLKSEGSLANYNSIVERFDNDTLTIITIVESEFPPTNYVANYNQSTDVTSYITFDKAKLAWEKAGFDENINILVSGASSAMAAGGGAAKTLGDCGGGGKTGIGAGGFHFSALSAAAAGGGAPNNNGGYNLLPITKPSMIEALRASTLQPDFALQQLSFKYKGVDAMVGVGAIKEGCKDLVEEEDSLSPSDLKPLIDAAKKCKGECFEHYASQVREQKSYFNRMVASLAEEEGDTEATSIKASLQGMKVNKIYPEYEAHTLPHPVVAHGFCGTQTIGNVKNPKYDDRSLFGLVDAIF